GEAEGCDGHVDWRQGQRNTLMAVEQIHQRESDGSAQKAVEGVEHGVPVGDNGVVGLHLPQNPGGENKEKDHNLQHIGQINLQAALKNSGQQEQNQREHTVTHVFKVAIKKLRDKSHKHQQAQ